MHPFACPSQRTTHKGHQRQCGDSGLPDAEQHRADQWARALLPVRRQRPASRALLRLLQRHLRPVRAALVSQPEAAELARQHNDANVLALGERLISVETAKASVNKFLSTEFEGGRHQRRVDKLSRIEKSSVN